MSEQKLRFNSIPSEEKKLRFVQPQNQVNQEVQELWDYATTPNFKIPTGRMKEQSIPSKPVIPENTTPIKFNPVQVGDASFVPEGVRPVSKEQYDIIMKERNRQVSDYSINEKLRNEMNEATKTLNDSSDLSVTERFMIADLGSDSARDISKREAVRATEKYFQFKYDTDAPISDILASLVMARKETEDLDELNIINRDIKQISDVYFADTSKNSLTGDIGVDSLLGDKFAGGAAVNNALESGVIAGLGSMGAGLASTLDVTAGNILKMFGWEDNPISLWNAAAQRDFNAEMEESQMAGIAIGDTSNISGTILQVVSAMIPDAILAYMTMGKSVSSSGTLKAIANAGQRNAAMQAAKTAITFDKATTPIMSMAKLGSGISSAASKAITTAAKNPFLWSSFTRTYGNDYQQAVEGGASQEVAYLYATVTSGMNALVEMGGGIQVLPSKLQNKTKSEILEWITSTLEEGGEEVIQSLISDINAKLMYDQDKEIISATNEEAIINPSLALDLGLGILGGGIMGGGQIAVGKLLNPTSYVRLGKNVRKAFDNDINGFVEYAKTSSNEEIRNVAESASNGKISNKELGILYSYVANDVNTAFSKANTVEDIANAMKMFDNAPEGVKTVAFSAQINRMAQLVKDMPEEQQAAFGGSMFTPLSAANGEKDAVTKSVEKVTGHMELTADQKELRRIGSQFGAKVEFADLDHYVTDENGNKVLVSPEGNYDPDTNTITLNTNAKEYHKPLEYILKHEMTHSLENNELYKQFSNAVISSQAFKDYVASKNYTSRAEWAKDIIDRYDRSGHPLGETDAQKQEGAMREQIANFVGDMLFGGRGDIATNLLNAMENKPRNAFIAWVKEKLSDIKRKLTGNAVTEIERIEREFLKVAYAVSDQNAQQQSVSKRNQNAAVNEKTTTDEGEATPQNVKENVEKVNVGIDEKTASASPISYSLASWEQSDYVDNRNTAAKELAEALGITQKKAKDYIDSINSIAKVIADDRTRLDYVAAKGRSTFVSNAEYGGSVDCSTLCPKRKILTGTFSAIQKALKNSALTAEEILDIRNRMKEKGLEVSCGLCYVEGSRAQMGKFSKEFIERYKKTNPEYVPDMFDVNTPEGVEQLRIDHPEVYEAYEKFWNNKGVLNEGDSVLFASQQKPKLYQTRTDYKGEILNKFKSEGNVVEKNKNGGLRLQSFSDFEIVHLIDMMQVVMDMSRVGLAGQAYTKVPDFALALGNTGLKINLSLIAKGVDADGNLIFDDVEGMPIDTAMRIRDMYSDNVGTILVVFNDAQLKAALADNRVDFIIPFHRSQWKKALYEKLGLPKGTKDYTYQQNEKYIKPVYYATRNGTLGKRKATNYMPNEYWDFGKSGKENAEAYLKMCAENNKRPKFYKLLVDNKDGSYSLQPDGSTDGYWKLLIDFKMYNNDGVGVPQQPVKPDFNMEESLRMLEEYKGGHQQFPVDQETVDEFVKDYKAKHKMDDFVKNEATEAKAPDNPYSNFSYSLSESDLDAEYMSSVESGDIEKAEFLMLEAAKRAGYTVEVYHGTNEYGYTKIDVSYSDDGRTFFVTDSEKLAKTYMDENMSTRGMYRLLLNESDFVEIDCKGKNWNNISKDLVNEALKEWDVTWRPPMEWENLGRLNTREVAHIIKYHSPTGGVKFKNLRDAGYFYYNVPHTVYACFYPEIQLKSAEIITYDDNGNVIPLSERFKSDNNDIRYSLPESDLDAEYMSAVERGDMETAQRMVDEAAKENGYNSPMLYHGTKMFGYTRIKTTGVEEGVDWSPFFATSKEEISATYVPYGKTRDISSTMDDDAIEEARNRAIEEREENITDLVDDFRSLIDGNISPWVFGQTDNSYLEGLVEDANPEPGHGDGVYDVLSEIVYDAYYDYQDEFGEYEDSDDWAENSPEGEEIFSKIIEIEGEKSALHRIEQGEELGGIYKLFANLDNMYVVDGKGAAWNELRPEGLPKLERYGQKDAPYKTRDVAKWARENGFDGVIFKNIRDNGAYGRTPAGDVYVFFNPESQVKSADPVTYDDNGNVIPLSQRFNAENEDIRYSLPESVDFDSLIDAVSRGEMSAEEAKRLSKNNKLLNPIEIANTPKSEASTTPKLDEPKMQGEGDGESNLHGSLDRSAIITDEVKEKIKADTYIKNYGTTTNKETLAKAMQRLDEGGAKEVYWWEKTLKPDEANAVNVAEGLILLQRYQDAGDTYGAIAVAEKLREIASASGQTVQIFSVIGRFTPEMMVAYSQHELDKAFKIMQEGRTKAWVEANAEKFQLTEEEKQAIYDKTLLASSLEDGSRVKAILLGEITTMLQNKLPPEKGQALRAWMRISLLFNVKTQFRNILGNASMILPYISSDFFGGLIDAAIAKKTGVRTTGFNAKTFGNSLVQGGKKGFVETYDDYKRRIHTKADELNRFETNAGSGKAFNENHQKLVALNKISKVLNEVDRLNSMLLEMGDRPFFEAWFMNALENQMRLNKVSEPTLQMVEMAKQEALQRTWQDDNNYTKAASGLKRALNTVQVGGYGLGDVVLKFVKTPSNIFKAMVELSPVGFGSAALRIRDMKIAMDKGEFTPAMQKEVVRSLSNAITGTAIYLLVYALAASGLIDFSGGGDEDKDVSNFEKYILGIPPYSFKFLGMDVTYTWNQPIGTVLAVVSDIMEDAEDGDINGWDAISTVGTVFTSQSFLSNLYEFFSKDDPLTGVVSAAFSEPSAAIPTLLSQMASVTDPYRRTSYDPSNPIKSALNDIIYRVPFLRTTLPKQVNVLGQDAKNPQFANIYKAFISPSTHYPKADMSVMDVSTEVYALYQATSDKTVMPRVAPNKVTIKGKEVTFSVDEKADFQRRTGELSVEILREMFALPEYDKLTDEEKTEAVSQVYNYVSDKAKSELDIYDYETLSAMEGTRTNGEPVLKRSTYDRMDDKAKQMLVDEYFFSKDERNCKGDPKKLAKLFVKKAKD